MRTNAKMKANAQSFDFDKTDKKLKLRINLFDNTDNNKREKSEISIKVASD